MRRFYSFRDLVALKVVCSLLDGGMSLQRIRRAYDYLRKKASLEQHLSEVKLITDGTSIFTMYGNDEELLDLLKEGQMAFFLVIDDATESEGGRKVAHLYDREDFVTTLRQVESTAEQELPPVSRRRVWAAR